jgi:MFS family permease
MHSESTTPDSGRGQWARVVRAPQVAALSIASVVARMPFGMGNISLVIFVHARTGSFGIAGLVTGFYTLAFALAGPLLGRLVDRRGSRAVLAPLAIVCALALLAVVAIGEASAATVPLIGASAVAGAAVPPVSGVLRRTWAELVPRQDLHTAFLFDSVLIEIVFVCGPLLTGLLAAAVDPAAPLLVSAGFVLVGTAWFLLVPVVRGERPAEHENRHPAGALASASIRYVTLSGLPLGASIGALDVAMPAFGAAHGNSALGGLFVASIACGSMLGAIAFGVIGRWFGDLRQASVRLGLYQPLVIVPLLLAPSPVALVPLAVLTGTFIAPMMTLRSRVAELTMPPGTGTETFTWLLLAVMVGASASSAVAGPLVQAGGWRVGVVLAIALPVAALPALFAGRRLLPTVQFQHE